MDDIHWTDCRIALSSKRIPGDRVLLYAMRPWLCGGWEHGRAARREEAFPVPNQRSALRVGLRVLEWRCCVLPDLETWTGSELVPGGRKFFEMGERKGRKDRRGNLLVTTFLLVAPGRVGCARATAEGAGKLHALLRVDARVRRGPCIGGALHRSDGRQASCQLQDTEERQAATSITSSQSPRRAGSTSSPFVSTILLSVCRRLSGSCGCGCVQRRWIHTTPQAYAMYFNQFLEQHEFDMVGFCEQALFPILDAPSKPDDRDIETVREGFGPPNEGTLLVESCCQLQRQQSFRREGFKRSVPYSACRMSNPDPCCVGDVTCSGSSRSWIAELANSCC